MKKIIASLLAIVSFSTMAFTAFDVSTAQILADQGIITNHFDKPLEYRLDDTITRAEAVGIALKVRGATLPENYSCQKYFEDVQMDSNNGNAWICRAVELAADAGFVTRENKIFRPNDTITRAEALGIFLKAGNIELIEDACGVGIACDVYSQYDVTIPWQKKIVFTAYSKGIVNPQRVIMEFHSSIAYTQFIFNPNQPAKRSDVFTFAQNTINARAWAENPVPPPPPIPEEPVATTGNLTKQEIINIQENAYIQGEYDAPLLLVEYGDMECPFCGSMHRDGVIVNLQAKYGDDLTYSFKHFPLDFHPLAYQTALIMECVADQGGADAYYMFKDLVFSSYPVLTKEYLADTLDQMQLRNETTGLCLQNKTHQEKIEAHIQEGIELFGVGGTPTSVIINAKTGDYIILPGAQPEQSFIDAIEQVR